MMMVSKMTRNGYGNLKSVLLSSSSLQNPFLQRSIISDNSVISTSPLLWKGCTPNGVVSPNPVGGTRFFSNALCKGRFKIPLTISNTRFHNYSSFNSLDCNTKRNYSSEGVVMGLIAANTAVSVLKVTNNEFVTKNFMISVDNINSGRLHTLITSGFSHHDTFHFATNMIGLYFFGTSIGQYFGPEYLLKLYASGAFVGSTCYLGYHAFVVPKLPIQMSYGKAPAPSGSGAVNSVVLLGLYLYPIKLVVTSFNLIDFVIPGPALMLGMFLIGMDIWRIQNHYTGFDQLGAAVVAVLALCSFVYGEVAIMY